MRKNYGITLIALIIITIVSLTIVGIIITIAVNKGLTQKKQKTNAKININSVSEIETQEINSNYIAENKITVYFLGEEYQVNEGSTLLDISLKSKQGIFTFSPDPIYSGYVNAILDGNMYNNGQTCIVFSEKSRVTQHKDNLTTYVLQEGDDIGLED